MIRNSVGSFVAAGVLFAAVAGAQQAQGEQLLEPPGEHFSVLFPEAPTFMQEGDERIWVARDGATTILVMRRPMPAEWAEADPRGHADEVIDIFALAFADSLGGGDDPRGMTVRVAVQTRETQLHGYPALAFEAKNEVAFFEKPHAAGFAIAAGGQQFLVGAIFPASDRPTRYLESFKVRELPVPPGFAPARWPRSISLGQTVTGYRPVRREADASDGRYAFNFYGRSGEQITIRARAGAGHTIRVSLSSTAGYYSDESSADPAGLSMSRVIPSTGTYQISLNDGGWYSLSLNATPENERLPTPPKQARIASLSYGATVRGELAPGDALDEKGSHYDVYRFRAGRGDRVTYVVEEPSVSDDAFSGALARTRVHLQRANGGDASQAVSFVDGNHWNYTFIANEDTELLLRITSPKSSPRTHDYVLSLTAVEAQADTKRQPTFYLGAGVGFANDVPVLDISGVSGFELAGGKWGQLDFVAAVLGLIHPEAVDFGGVFGPGLRWGGDNGSSYFRVWGGPAVTFDMSGEEGMRFGVGIRAEYAPQDAGVVLFGHVHSYGSRAGWQLGVGLAM